MPGRLARARDAAGVGFDATAVKTLAHPLRSRLLVALRRGGPSTAPALAAALGTNSGATSYHLRRLADVGLIDETDGGRGRERRWQAATDRPSWKGSDFADDEDAATALNWLERDYLRHFTERAERFLDVRDQWPATWSDELGLSDGLALVDLDQLRRLRSELDAVLARYARIGQGHPGARRVAVYTHLYPIDIDHPPRREERHA